MADGSDDPRQIDALARLVERGVVIAAASRYSGGGQQVGGPMLKSLMSRSAGRSLATLARVGTRDATNSFKAYSTDFVREVGIHSRSAFEIGLELTAKARRLRRPVAELSTIWLESHVGESSFDLRRGCPSTCAGTASPSAPQLTLEQVTRERSASRRPTTPTRERSVADPQRVLVTGSAGFIGGYVVEELLRRGYAVRGLDDYSKYGPVEKSYDDHPPTTSPRVTPATSSWSPGS